MSDLIWPEAPEPPYDVSAQEIADEWNFRLMYADIVASLREYNHDMHGHYMDGLAFMLCRLPSHEILVQQGFRDPHAYDGEIRRDERTLTGLYSKKPFPVVTLFWKVIVSNARVCDLDLWDFTRDIILHEIGHHLGLGHEQLRELGI